MIAGLLFAAIVILGLGMTLLGRRVARQQRQIDGLVLVAETLMQTTGRLGELVLQPQSGAVTR